MDGKILRNKERDRSRITFKILRITFINQSYREDVKLANNYAEVLKT